MVQSMVSGIKHELVPVLHAREGDYINDTIRQDLLELIKNLEAQYKNISIFSHGVARRNANQIDQLNINSFIAKANAATGLDTGQTQETVSVESIIKSHVDDNVKLIKSIPDQFFDRVRNVVLTGLENGTRANVMAKQLLTKGKAAEVKQVGVAGITFRRAKLIARDQTNKLNGSITQVRQMSLGIEDYIWRDSGDNRVRAQHIELNGQTFSWKGEPQPPLGLAPGQPILCRCTAEGVVIL